MTEKRFSQGYAEYIRSEGWREKAQLRKAIDGNRCVLCGSADNLQVGAMSMHTRTRSISRAA